MYYYNLIPKDGENIQLKWKKDIYEGTRSLKIIFIKNGFKAQNWVVVLKWIMKSIFDNNITCNLMCYYQKNKNTWIFQILHL